MHPFVQPDPAVPGFLRKSGTRHRQQKSDDDQPEYTGRNIGFDLFQEKIFAMLTNNK